MSTLLTQNGYRSASPSYYASPEVLVPLSSHATADCCLLGSSFLKLVKMRKTKKTLSDEIAISGKILKGMCAYSFYLHFCIALGDNQGPPYHLVLDIYICFEHLINKGNELCQTKSRTIVGSMMTLLFKASTGNPAIFLSIRTKQVREGQKFAVTR